MKIADFYKSIDKIYTETLKKHGFAYRVDKVRKYEIWTVQIGKFNGMQDAWIQSEISNYEKKSIEKQFADVLKTAISDKVVNYN